MITTLIARGLLVLTATLLMVQWEIPAQPSEINRAAIVYQITLTNEAVTPVTAQFVARAVREAESQNAEALILVLDTPGGLIESTRDVVKTLLHSRIPIAVYVAPTGARAASAGMFITMAAHIAAMGPGTNIGAAHPVQVGGLPGSDPPEPAKEEKNEKDGERRARPMEEKVLNDTVAWARSLAELRGRNVDWAERAVRESISATASDALKEGAIDILASDTMDLISQMNGRDVRLLDRQVILDLKDPSLITVEMWWGERVLSILANPTLAFLLLMFGFYGVLFEFYSPGWGVSGTVGIVCLVLGFFSMAVLPVSYVGIALIVIALTMFIAEAFVVSYGFLTVGGAICLVLGGVMLVESPVGFTGVPFWLLIPISVAASLISFFLIGSVVRAHRNPTQSGGSELSKEEAVALDRFSDDGQIYRGRVRVHGEIWNAVSYTQVEKNDRLQIEGRDGLTLKVRGFVKGPLAGQGEENNDR